MNTEEIDRILRRYVRDFDAVFSVDTLPEKPRLLVCNTDASDKPGQHWICMHFEDGRGEYFDSFGRRPTANFERYLTDTARRGRLIVDNYRVLLVNFADIIVFIIVCLEVEV